MTYIITMQNGRQYKVDEYDDTKYGSDWLKFYNASNNTTDRFMMENIEYINVRGRGEAEYIGNINSNK